MNRERIKSQLRIDEGRRLDVYRDTKGYLTCGYGHKVLPTDNLIEHTYISDQQAEAFLDHDLDNAILDCENGIKGFEKLPEELQEVLVNMVFQMGLTGVLEFEKFFKHVYKEDYHSAALCMVNSIWFMKDTPSRALREMNIVANLGGAL